MNRATLQAALANANVRSFLAVIRAGLVWVGVPRALAAAERQSLLDHVGVATRGFDFRAQVLEQLDAAAGQHNGGASLGQGQRELLAQAARCAGDQRC